MNLDDFDFNITIVGLGLIGGSYAMALKKLVTKNIWAVDIDAQSLEKAERMGIIDKGYKDPRIPLAMSDIVIMCLYPDMILEFTKTNLQYFKEGCIITDVAGIKDSLVRGMMDCIREDMDFIGGHPMAGREYKGIDYAKADLFKGCNYILTPTDENKKESIEIISNMVKSLGCKEIVNIKACRHDEIMAHTSQLPHITAAALINGIEEDSHLFVAGSFKDATRVARLNGRLWAELIIDNQYNSISKIDKLQCYLNNVRDMINNQDHDGLESMFDEARRRQEEFTEKCVH